MFSGAQKRAELLCNPCILGGPQQGGQIRSGYLTPAFSRAQKRTELLRNPCILGGPQKGVQKGPHRASRKKPLRGGSLRVVLNKKKFSVPKRLPWIDVCRAQLHYNHI